MAKTYGKNAWKQVKNLTITPYGTETMHLLRAEKGFIIVGQDTDATMTPIDLQMIGLLVKKNMTLLVKDLFIDLTP